MWLLSLGWCLFCCVRFFFFKQKTAYEMRISDWSSDVCSSDLSSKTCKGVYRSLLNAARCAVWNRDVGRDMFFMSGEDLTTQAGLSEIGRASCRERVCQYV